MLAVMAKFHKFIILDGRRITPSTKADHAPDSIIQLEIDGELFVGQLTGIFSHTQRDVAGTGTFLRVQWFRPYPGIDTHAWDP